MQIMALVLGIVILLVGIYIVSQVISSFTLATEMKARTVNESVTFAANNTLYNFANQASCLNDDPMPTNCGVDLTSGVVQVSNNTVLLGSGNYTWTRSQIRLYTQSCANCYNTSTGAYDVTYDYYDYPTAQSGTSYRSAQSTTWNAIQLAAVSLITLAAAMVLGSLFLKR